MHRVCVLCKKDAIAALNNTVIMGSLIDPRVHRRILGEFTYYVACLVA